MICVRRKDNTARNTHERILKGRHELFGLEALDDKALRYAAAKQIFYKSGKTLYDAGRPSWGNWRPQGGQYCSEWPPLAHWACYDLFVNADRTMVRFVGASGTDISDGVYVEVRE